MQTKFAALESKSRAVVAQQSHAVSGATLALSDLSARLTDLVEQLIASYNISEQELEVSELDFVCYFCFLLLLQHFISNLRTRKLCFFANLFAVRCRPQK